MVEEEEVVGVVVEEVMAGVAEEVKFLLSYLLMRLPSCIYCNIEIHFAFYVVGGGRTGGRGRGSPMGGRGGGRSPMGRGGGGRSFSGGRGRGRFYGIPTLFRGYQHHGRFG